MGDRIAEVLRRASDVDERGRKVGAHAAIRELGAQDIADAVWSELYRRQAVRRV